jgi:hypothetical protein
MSFGWGKYERGREKGKMIEKKEERGKKGKKLKTKEKYKKIFQTQGSTEIRTYMP